MKKIVFVLSITFLMTLLVACGGEEPTVPSNTVSASDTLVLSLNRLKEVDLNVSLDALVETTTTNQGVSQATTLSSILIQEASPGTVSIDSEIDALYYLDLPHTSNIGLEFRNLNEGISSYALQSKSRVDWAIENITLMDTWVEAFNEKYLLTYDESQDLVSLSIANVDYVSKDDTEYNLKHIDVTYNDEGFMVVSVYDAYKTETFASFGRLTYIKDTLYEWSSDIWSNGVLEENPMSGGKGWFKAYIHPTTNLWTYFRSSDQNISFNIQTPNGWLQTFISIPQALELNNQASFSYIKVADNQLENDVFSMDLFDRDETSFAFYPAAFEGWTNIQTSLTDITLKNLQDWNPIYDNIPLYEANEAQLTFDNDVIPGLGQEVKTSVRPSNVDDVSGNSFVAYVAESVITFDQHYLDLLIPLKERFSAYGLTYKHGDLDVLFNETIETILNLGRLFDQFTLNGQKGFTDISLYLDVINDEMDVIRFLADRFDRTYVGVETVLFSDLPALDTETNQAIQIENFASGAMVFNTTNQTLTSGTYAVTLNPSVLLQTSESYTVVYALLFNQSLIYVTEEAPLVYEGQSMVFNGNINIDLNAFLLDGTYTLVSYIARKVEDGLVRVSSVMRPSVEAFDVTSISTETQGFDQTLTYTNNNGLVITKASLDTEAPTLTVLASEWVSETVSFQGTVNQNLAITSTESLNLDTLLSFVEITDNAGDFVLITLTSVTFNGNVMTTFNQTIEVGVYVITIEDQASNQTVLTITVS